MSAAVASDVEVDVSERVIEPIPSEETQPQRTTSDMINELNTEVTAYGCKDELPCQVESRSGRHEEAKSEGVDNREEGMRWSSLDIVSTLRVKTSIPSLEERWKTKSQRGGEMIGVERGGDMRDMEQTNSQGERRSCVCNQGTRGTDNRGTPRDTRQIQDKRSFKTSRTTPVILGWSSGLPLRKEDIVLAEKLCQLVDEIEGNGEAFNMESQAYNKQNYSKKEKEVHIPLRNLKNLEKTTSPRSYDAVTHRGQLYSDKYLGKSKVSHEPPTKNADDLPNLSVHQSLKDAPCPYEYRFRPEEYLAMLRSREDRRREEKVKEASEGKEKSSHKRSVDRFPDLFKDLDQSQRVKDAQRLY